MPLITVRLVREPLSDDRKQALASAVTDAVATTLGKDPSSCWVIIEEIDAGNWAVGGQTIAERRRAK